jgi:hypothetical protein
MRHPMHVALALTMTMAAAAIAQTDTTRAATVPPT